MYCSNSNQFLSVMKIWTDNQLLAPIPISIHHWTKWLQMQAWLSTQLSRNNSLSIFISHANNSYWHIWYVQPYLGWALFLQFRQSYPHSKATSCGQHRNIQVTVECRYNVVWNNMILCTSLQKLRQNINHRLSPKRHLIPRPEGWAVGWILQIFWRKLTML